MINKYDNDWPIVAICYDFDKTLSPQDMQNFALIPSLGCKVESFWKESNKYAKEQGMDSILSYMKLILKKASDKNVGLKESDFIKLGESIELFPGVDTWFNRINSIAKKLKINVEHYIISAGLKEIIKGTSISHYFTEIYASSFAYGTYDEPIWPKQVVNYTSKTQYLFRISKNCLDLSDENSVNQYIDDAERRIPFSHFIYIGDSDTDIPAMKIIKNGKGTSIGVYNPSKVNITKVSKLLKQNRIDYLMPSDYSEDSKIEHVVSEIFKKIVAQDNLLLLNKKQKLIVDKTDDLDGFLQYTEEFIKKADGNNLKEVSKQTKKIMRDFKKELGSLNDDVFTNTEIEIFWENKNEELKAIINNRMKKINKKEAKNITDTTRSNL